MKFWYSKYVSYFLFILMLLIPFNISIQLLPENDYTLTMVAPIWQYWTDSMGDYVGMQVNPFGLIYIIWFWPSALIVKLAYDAAVKENTTRFNYAVKVVGLMFIQFAFSFFFPFVSGSPPVTNIPLVFMSIIALILTRWTVPVKTQVWDEEETEEEDQVF